MGQGELPPAGGGAEPKAVPPSPLHMIEDPRQASRRRRSGRTPMAPDRGSDKCSLHSLFCRTNHLAPSLPQDRQFDDQLPLKLGGVARSSPEQRTSTALSGGARIAAGVPCIVMALLLCGSTLLPGATALPAEMERQAAHGADAKVRGLFVRRHSFLVAPQRNQSPFSPPPRRRASTSPSRTVRRTLRPGLFATLPKSPTWPREKLSF